MVYSNFRNIPGTKLYRGSKPDDLDKKEKDKLEQEYGIKCIIDLRSPKERKHTKETVVTFSEFCFLLRNSKYRSGTVNSKSFVGKVLLRIKRKFELTYAL